MTADLHPFTWMQVVVTVLAAYRITVLVTRDSITRPIRDKLSREYEGWVVTLVNCPWCIGFWISCACVALTYFFWPVWGWVALGFAVSGAVGYLSDRT